MKCWILLLFLTTCLSVTAWSQPSKDAAAALPIGYYRANLSQGQMQRMSNELEADLSELYTLKTEEQVKKALENAYNTAGEKCTPSSCIQKIQSTLGVRRVFRLEVIQEGGGSLEFSLSLVTTSGKIVRNQDCNGCGSDELADAIDQLVDTVAFIDIGQHLPSMVYEHDVSSWHWKVGLAVTATVVFAALAASEASAVKSSQSKQDNLTAQAQAATSTAQYNTLYSELTAEESNGMSHYKKANDYLGATALFGAWALWELLDKPTLPSTAFYVVPPVDRYGTPRLVVVAHW